MCFAIDFNETTILVTVYTLFPPGLRKILKKKKENQASYTTGFQLITVTFIQQMEERFSFYGKTDVYLVQQFVLSHSEVLIVMEPIN